MVTITHDADGRAALQIGGVSFEMPLRYKEAYHQLKGGQKQSYAILVYADRMVWVLEDGTVHQESKCCRKQMREV
jgi:hypothetical protein